MNLKQTIIAGTAVAALFLSGCSVEQTREARLPDVDVQADAGSLPKFEVRKTADGRLPSVDVDAKGGQMPEFDVDVAEIQVGTEEKDVTVPKPVVVVEEEQIDVPDVDVRMPEGTSQPTQPEAK
jgi:uncharacterized lipoprotein